MREIKFRAWDGEKIYYLEAFKDKSNHYLEVGTDGFWLYTSDTGTKITSTIDGGILMQYTGLKDKNGKEIYEGDIVSSETYEINKQEVKWFYTYWHPFEYYMSNTESFEVIGNIYENPELLKQP